MKNTFRALLTVLFVFCLSHSNATHAAKKMIPPSVAVMYFDYNGANPDLTLLRKGLAQMLISDLGTLADNAHFVERDRLEDILKELELSSSKKVDQKTAARIGKLIGARYMVVGSFFDMMGQLRVDSRLINVETGEILGSVGQRGKVDDFFEIEQKLAKDLGLLLKTKAKPVEYDASKPKRALKKKNKKKTKKNKKKRTTSKKKIKRSVIVQYSKALDAKDKGDTPKAVKILKQVVKEQPDFDMAAIDLSSLVQ